VHECAPPALRQVRFAGGLVAEGRSPADNAVTLRCKRFVFDPDAKKVLRQ
jgi:selenocysteine-specific elongation factor